MMSVLVVLHLIALHTVEGFEIAINPEQVTNLHPTREDQKKDGLFVTGVNCIVGLTDGKFMTVKESCDTVRRLIEENAR